MRFLLLALFICLQSYSWAGELRDRIVCTAPTDASRTAAAGEKIYESENPKAAANLTYKMPELDYSNGDRTIRQVRYVPDVSLAAFGGWLLGDNRGEWGGELLFRPSKGKDVVLEQDNIKDIYVMPFGIVATAGLAHMSANHGLVYLVGMSPKGAPVSRRLHGLPGAPRSSWLLNTGELLINTTDGSVLLKNDASLAPVKCLSTEP